MSYSKNSDDFLSEYILSPIYSVTTPITNTINKNITPVISNGLNAISPDYIVNNPITNNISNTIEHLDDVTSDVFDNTVNTLRSEDNILMTIIESIRSDWFRILLVVCIILLLSFLIIANSVTKNKQDNISNNKEKETINLVIREGLTNKEKNNLLNSFKKGFCKVNSGNSKKLNNECKKLTKDVCNMTECCVYAKTGNKESCMAGDNMGPTYQYDSKDNKLNFDYYYYMGKCNGNC
jgi:hypothetical protein